MTGQISGQIFKPLRAIGLMSGTSLDGVDAAWIETDGVSVTRTGIAATLHYEPDLRAD
jgi:anhydro-N-acetylmuramic acid kinase